MFIINLLITIFVIILVFKLVALLFGWLLVHKIKKLFAQNMNGGSTNFNHKQSHWGQKHPANGSNEREQQNQDYHNASHVGPSSTHMPKMVKCETCGIFLADNEAVERNRKYYCSDEHVR